MIDIIYADNAIVVVNKPENLLSVPGRGPDKKDCVHRRVQSEFPTARVVHRLDCATSGLMVLALSVDSHRELSRQFHDRETAKQYQALVLGKLASSSGEVKLPLITDWPNRPKQIVREDGKAALTQYRLLDYKSGVSRVGLTPVTGRTHQLRVHMQSLGHPIAGDKLYAPAESITDYTRLMLHAHKLEISQPDTKKRMSFESPVPF